MSNLLITIATFARTGLLFASTLVLLTGGCLLLHSFLHWLLNN